MVKGFVLIDTLPAREQMVYNSLQGINEIKELYMLFGGYDILALIEGDSFDTIGDIVVNKVRAVDGISHTRTLTVVEL